MKMVIIGWIAFGGIGLMFLGIFGSIAFFILRDAKPFHKTVAAAILICLVLFESILFIGANSAANDTKDRNAYIAAIEQDAIDHPCISWSNPYATGGTLADVVCIQRKE